MSGVYCIKVDNAIVYVGKAKDLNERMRQHWNSIFTKSEENKYVLLNSARGRKHKITFWLLEECEEIELKSKETYWIHSLRPCLNSSNNGGIGRRLTAQEFYDVVFNQTDYVEGIRKLRRVNDELILD